MKSKSQYLIFINIVYLLFFSPPVMSDWQEEVINITEKYGVNIIFDKIEFPLYWENWNPEWSVVPINKRAQVLERLRVDLSHYDKTFLIKNLSKVYLLNNLSFNKQIYGGTNDHYLQWLYINVRWLGDDSRHIKAMGFHHEFSSILYKKNKSIFNEIKWKHINKKEFKYAYNKSLDTNIKSGKIGLVGNNSLYEEGFICSYGTLTLEDDINTFSQYLIAKPDILKTLMNKHKRIKEKVNLLVSFYKDIGYKSAH